jgi:hypothetical protein
VLRPRGLPFERLRRVPPRAGAAANDEEHAHVRLLAHGFLDEVAACLPFSDGGQPSAGA